MKLGVVINTVTKYWKYEYTAWTQPKLSSNGTMGGLSFALTGGNSNKDDISTLYKVSDGSTSAYFNGTQVGFYITFYNPIPLKVSTIKWQASEPSYIARQGTVYGSNDGINFTQITTYNNSTPINPYTIVVNANMAYKYWKIQITQAHNKGSGCADIAEVTLMAQEQQIVSGTSTDYNFTTQEYEAKLPVLDNKFQAPII